MDAIRTKIFVVIVLLMAAMGVSAMIYIKGGFSLTSKEETQGYCGTVSTEPIITNIHGRDLFFANCASCHSIHKELTGPALAGFEKRFPISKLYLFIQQPQKAYRKSKYLTRLKQEYNNMEHYAFPNLAKEDIDNIRQYINEAGKPYGY